MIRKIEELLKRSGIPVFGYAKTEGIKIYGEIEPLPFAISFGMVLSRSILMTITDRPSLIYKHHYRTVNNYLDQVGLRLTELLEVSGYQALPIPASQIIDWENQFGHLSHREIARRAGLGWIGRSGLLIHPKYRAAVRFATVLTDLELPGGKELPFGCGDCFRCLEACPAQAITEDGVDLRKCYQKLREFAKIRGIGQYICGVCIKACL
ncbi:hypothetical protein DRP53_02430 [candidate division WOR-3 bacterium]|uniref:4Fe-4S ferredoxin-type domain-containing protein n=1 Tax=candidate division WOR-3 bacterium TaxID=2052148 RepID=A0A660SKH1_UNCW3|nr:MAG: hypothetical protein DRP53_02430 [candidate division WOR-3 bacterium]